MIKDSGPGGYTDSPVNTREQALRRWATHRAQQLIAAREPLGWQSLAGDASFRHFYRIRRLTREHTPKIDSDSSHPTSLIAMDAPPETENNHQFLVLSEKFRRAGIAVPEVLAADLDQGFLLVSDFGDALYSELYAGQATDTIAPVSHRPDIDQAMDQAMKTLLDIQCIDTRDGIIPTYSLRRFEDELNLFTDWFLAGLLQTNVSQSDQAMLSEIWQMLLSNTQQQPQVCLHRDYHSRNLLRGSTGKTLVVDFQDALIGPVAYDPVSLLRDCYVNFAEGFVEDWRDRYLDYALARGILTPQQAALFPRWFDLTGIQRHLKAIGIFSRLMLRDARPSHLEDILPVLQKLIHVCRNDKPFEHFALWLQEDIQPRARARLSELMNAGHTPA